MRTKLFLALAAVVAFATSAHADLTISDAGYLQNTNINLSPAGDYFSVPGLGSAAEGFFIGGGPFVDSTFNDAGEAIGPDILGGNVTSSDLLTDNGGGSFNMLLTLSTDSGDFAPAGVTGPGGSTLDLLGWFVGGNAGGTPIDWNGATVISANLDAFDGGGASLFGGPVELVGLGFDIQSGSWGVNFGGGAGLGIETITLDVELSKAIPEPTSIAIMSVLGLGLVTRRRR